jgi:4-hydroxy-2-oxoglutarate aldolase
MPNPPHLMNALVTPFDASGDIDTGAHRRNVEIQLSRGIRGFVLGGSTGEGPYLEAGERSRLVRLAREAAGEDVFLVCGIAAQSVRQAIGQAAEIASAGADAALAMTPTSLARGNHAAVGRYFEAVAEQSPVPIFLYSVPAVTGYELPVDTVVPIAAHPNVIGMKDSGGRPVHIKEIVQATPDDFILYAGSSSTITQAMAAGARGAITASSNYLPETLSALVLHPREAGNGTDSLQSRLTAVTREVEAFGVPGTKAAAIASGLTAGIPRLPLQPLARTDQARLAQIVSAARAELLAAAAG